MEFPFAIDLQPAEGVAVEGRVLSGRIVSDLALHYAGDPSIEVGFLSNPTECDPDHARACVTYLEALSSTIVVGGRFEAFDQDRDGEPDCPFREGFQYHEMPWLIEGFIGKAKRDQQTGDFYRGDCRDRYQPYGVEDDARVLQNLSLASSNPIPDGKSRVREIEFIDGMLINHERILVLFRERYVSFWDDENGVPFYAYGIMNLKRSPATLAEDAFSGNAQSEVREQGGVLWEESVCGDALLGQIPGFIENAGIGSRGNLNAEQIVTALIHGTYQDWADIDGEDAFFDSRNMHYLCHETGYFDGGPYIDDRDEVSRHACPAGSNVTFFTEDVAFGENRVISENLRRLNCQDDGSCAERLDQWVSNPDVTIVINPIYRCINEEGEVDQTRNYCSENRQDLTADKRFYKPLENENAPAFTPLLTSIEDAFRYKTRFQNRQGSNIGFAPTMCEHGGDAEPYCYDPVAIEEIGERIDCIVYLHQVHRQNLLPETLTEVRRLLEFSFSYHQERNAFNELRRYDGFERLNAELLIMLGDEAYTSAFRSRFDLVGIAAASFEGSLLEPNGIDLSGVVGFEMLSLYKAVQYYQMVLDRFYAMSPYIWRQITEEAQGSRYIGQRAVVSYFQKLLGASTQRSRAWSEIAKRYQSLNRPDLAKFVVQRAYTSAYLESVLFSNLMTQIIEMPPLGNEDATNKEQVVQALNRAARVYRVALYEMREVYADFTDEVNYFGFSADYIPLPAYDPEGPNVVETLLGHANQSAQEAAAIEQLAVESNDSYETDSASFQAELVKIRTTHERDLGDICGTFEADNGNVYPAITKYAPLSEPTRLLGDPCGLMGNGDIWEEVSALEIQGLSINEASLAFRRVKEEINIEIDRVNALCEEGLSLANIQYNVQGEINQLDRDIRDAELSIVESKRTLETALYAAEIAACAGLAPIDGGMCLAKLAASSAKDIAFNVHDQITGPKQREIFSKQNKINALQQELVLVEANSECNRLRINQDASIAEKVLRLPEIELDALRADYTMRLGLSKISKLRDKAKRIESEQRESEELLINIEASRNDPNVRIYKNDAVLNAEKAFEAAIRDAYRATKVFEYYSSQSYEAIEQLSLVRMVAHGGTNLNNYLRELREAYFSFGEAAGRPDVRVDILSVRDEILSIPRYGEDGRVLTQSERTERFRAALTDSRLLSNEGYLTMPFSTGLSRLSPITRNHKITHIEVEIVSADAAGDDLGRVYLNQSGTGVVYTLDDEKQYYRFPERTAVINPFFNGARVFGADVYQNQRFRDRPYVNTHWKLVLNQRNEEVNQDINLNGVTDIRLHLYYSDFTEF